MELNLMIKTTEKTKDNSKNFFSKLCFISAILVGVIYLINAKYNFYVGVTSKKEMIEVNAVYSNQSEND